MRSFGSELLHYITTIVPYWRVCDEAWSVESRHITGIGVLRNYGGQVLVVAWNEQTRRQLEGFHELPGSYLSRIVVVVDDRGDEAEVVSAALAPIVVLPWSRRSELAAFLIKETPD